MYIKDEAAQSRAQRSCIVAYSCVAEKMDNDNVALNIPQASFTHWDCNIK